MKKLISILTTAIIVMMSANVFAAAIPDHHGTSLDSFAMGTSKLASTVKNYSQYFHDAGNQFGVDPNVIAAMCMQESGGRFSVTDGIMQITSVNAKGFADFGLDQTGVAWTLDDRYDPQKSILYASYLLSQNLYRYDGDYAKMLQAYNFGWPTLNKIIDSTGDDWLNERVNAKNYVANWPYSGYGDPLYIEHVLRYYHHDIEYNGAKVRVNGNLIKFNNQSPLVIETTTLVPIRSISEYLGAKVSWDGSRQCASISKDGNNIDLYIGSNVAYINGNLIYMDDIPATMINNTTMVPVRFVAEAFGLDVNWNHDCYTVEITY